MVKLKNKKGNKFFNFLKLIFIPGQSNDYRPHLIRRYGLVLIAVVVIGLHLGYENGLLGGDISSRNSITIDELFDKTNQTRESYDLEPLVLDKNLSKAAQLKANDMVDNKYWSHTSPSGVEPWYWFDQVNYKYNEAGENLAKNFYNIDTVMLAWMNSSGHRDNILYETYQEVGFAMADGEIDGKPTSIIVALYGRPSDGEDVGVNPKFIQPDLDVKNNLLVRLAIASRSITTFTLFGLALVFVAIIVSSLSHTKRKKLPDKHKRSFYRFHGLIKAAVLLILALLIIWAYGSGQIL